jgi:hypothetical protein
MGRTIGMEDAEYMKAFNAGKLFAIDECTRIITGEYRKQKIGSSQREELRNALKKVEFLK